MSDMNINLKQICVLPHFLTSVEKYHFLRELDSQPAFTCSKLTIETLEQGVKYVQS